MGIDGVDDRVVAFFNQLRSQIWLTATQRSWTSYLFHFTDISNLPSILESGFLKPRSALESQGMIFKSTANEDILDHTPDYVKQCVRLYFRPLVPMLYSVEGVRPAAAIAGAPHCPTPVYLLFDSNPVLSLPNALVSNGNLSSTSFDQILESPATGLWQIPFEDVFHDRWLSDEEKQRILFHRQAETIIPGSLDLRHLRWIMVRSEAEGATLKSQIGRHSRSLLRQYESIIRVNSRDSLFFRRWIYVEDAWYDGANLGVQVNADARSRGPFHMKLEIRDAMGSPGSLWKSENRDVHFPQDSFQISIPERIRRETIEVQLFLDGHLVYDNRLAVGGLTQLR